MLEVRLLGRFEIKHGSKAVNVTSRPAQTLFAFLILNAGTAYRREKLAGQLWPDTTEESARDYLRHALWRIRKALQLTSSTRYLRTDDVTIAFEPAAEYWLDAAALRDLQDNESADALMQVLRAYDGELLPGFYDEWISLEREHMQAIFERKMERLLGLLEESGRWTEMLEWGERWIALGQRPEGAYRRIMTAHAAQGEMSKMAAAYERCVKSLADIGTEPSEQTRALYHNLKSGAGIQGKPEPALRVASTRRPDTGLPVPLTSFIGRERVIDEIVHLLEGQRLVTLTGSGGVGKTRLAIQLATKVLGKFKDGACWIELASLSDPALVVQAIASGVNVRESANEPLILALRRYFANKKILLILDNCEHLILEAARTAEFLLGACPNLRILATSRESLGIRGEQVYEVPTLSAPSLRGEMTADSLPVYESARLFVDRAKAVRPGFNLTDENAAAVHQICRRLDGIPLAIELAAARTKLLAVEHVATRLNDRFNLLTQGSRTALPRQQTLRATIDWSYDLLPDEARVLLRRLGVFAGSFTLEAAEAICSGAPLNSQSLLDLLARLVDRSLVKVERQGRHQRYSMLETIREYARERLDASGEIETLRRRHRDFFIAFAEDAQPRLRSTEQVAWLDRLDEDLDNLRAAWDSAIQADPELALRLASALADFWYRRGNPNEGREWMTQLLPFARQWGPTAYHAHAFSMAGWLAHVQQDAQGARTLLQEALEVARASGDMREIAFALQWLGWTIALSQQEPQTAQALLQESLSIYERIEDQWGMAMGIAHLGWLAQFDGRYAEAEERGRASLAKFRQIGDMYWFGGTLNNLGELARTQADYRLAGTYYEQFRAISQELGSRVAVAIASGNLAWVALHDRDLKRAEPLLKECLEFSMECGNRNGATTCLVGFAGMLEIKGAAEQAAKLLAAVGALREASGLGRRMEPVDETEFEHYLALVRERLDEAAFAAAWEAGCSMNLEDAVAFAVAETQTRQDA